MWWPARQVVKNAILTRKQTHISGEIIELKDRCPWKEHLFEIEKELDIDGEVKFVVFHDAADSWRVQGIPIQPDSFVCRYVCFIFFVSSKTCSVLGIPLKLLLLLIYNSDKLAVKIGAYQGKNVV